MQIIFMLSYAKELSFLYIYRSKYRNYTFILVSAWIKLKPVKSLLFVLRVKPKNYPQNSFSTSVFCIFKSPSVHMFPSISTSLILFPIYAHFLAIKYLHVSSIFVRFLPASKCMYFIPAGSFTHWEQLGNLVNLPCAMILRFPRFPVYVLTGTFWRQRTAQRWGKEPF